MKHGQIKVAELWVTRSQPNFKHWWKIWDGKTVRDIYFTDDNPMVVTLANSSAMESLKNAAWIVNPKGDMIRTEVAGRTIDIYHVISKP